MLTDTLYNTITYDEYLSKSISKVSTLRTIEINSPEFNEDFPTVKKYMKFPDITGERVTEGGLRLQGSYKKSQENMPLVSIITVCLNSEKTIKQTFDSVFLQDYDNIEYIVIDGKSSDNTLNIIEQHKDKIDYYISEPDKGLYDAMNKGLSLASGDYILILNSDDYYTLDAVSSLIAAKNYGACDFVSAQRIFTFSDSTKNYLVASIPFNATVYLNNPLVHETILISAEIYNKFGFYNTDYKIIADWVFIKKLFDAGLTLYEIPRPLLMFSRTGVSSINMEKLNRERAIFLKSIFPFLENDDVFILANREELTKYNINNILYKYDFHYELVEALLYTYSSKINKAVLTSIWKNNNYPKVSIILPIYNAENTLANTLDSILSQTLEEIEIICIDDCSKDASSTILNEYKIRDSRILIRPNLENIGHGASRNRGIKLARGEYIFHIDPDDTLPINALELLYNTAKTYDSDITKGVYVKSQKTVVEKIKKTYVAGKFTKKIFITTLNESEDIFHTDAHWNYLYKAEFIKTIFYPTDQVMGQDFVFLVKILCMAKSITLSTHISYNYLYNDKSAMSSFNIQKCLDSIKSRYRAYHILLDYGHEKLAEKVIYHLWNRNFFMIHSQVITQAEDWKKYLIALKSLLQLQKNKFYNISPYLEPFFNAVLNGENEKSRELLDTPSYNIATLCTLSEGGATRGSLRRISALNNYNHNAYLCTAQMNNEYRIPTYDINGISLSPKNIVNAISITSKDVSTLNAYELFSRAISLTDFRSMQNIFNEADIVHLHWVVGVFDYEHAEILANKPVVWTCADMNPFTGGCHYSEGCEEYVNECMNCPLLGENSLLAHENWKIKKEAYSKLNNLHIICPSEWLASCAIKSSLFKDKPIHYIPNAFPTDKFIPINKKIARLHLGLPLDKKLFIFGAEDLNNKRKGGKTLLQALNILRNEKIEDFEIVLFGHNSIDLPYKTHNLGFFHSPEELSFVYSAADAFLFPSFEDNAPLTVAEAMLCGTPVVAFFVGNVSELIKHKELGYIATNFSVQDFANGIRFMLNLSPTESIKKSLACRIMAKQYNNPVTSAYRHTKLYEEIMSI